MNSMRGPKLHFEVGDPAGERQRSIRAPVDSEHALVGEMGQHQEPGYARYDYCFETKDIRQVQSQTYHRR